MFCPQFAPVIGGAERQAEKLGKILIERGISVEVWTQQLDPALPLRESLDGLPVNRFPVSNLAKVLLSIPGMGIINAPWIMAQIIVRLWGAIGRSDVVHCHIGSLQTVAVGVAARLRKRPVICKAAVADVHSDLGEMARSGLTGRLAARLARSLFTRWVATSQAVRDALLRAGVCGERIVVIPNAVEIQSIVTRDRSGSIRRFLYLGRLSSNTRRDTPGLIAAFDRLASDMPDAELALVGGGDLFEETSAQVAACKYSGRIRRIGPDEAGPWFDWADCFVLPSRREGLSNALLEAMARGLPCIAYDIPPNREVLAQGKAGLLVPGDADHLEAAMRSLANEREEAHTLGARGRKRAEDEYSIDMAANQYIRLYDKLSVMDER